MNTIEKNVMASVRMIYAARVLMSATACKAYVLVLSAYGIASFVSVSHVLANAAQVGLAGVYGFALAAVAHTQLPVQLTLMVGIIAAGTLASDLIRTMTERPTFATSRPAFR